jgi:basic amino acid/polyamine antiporter, APA family
MLRRRQPRAARPYRALGYPVSTAIVLLGSVSFLVLALLADWHAGLLALFLSLCVPACAFAARSRPRRLPALASEPS